MHVKNVLLLSKDVCLHYFSSSLCLYYSSSTREEDMSTRELVVKLLKEQRDLKQQLLDNKENKNNRKSRISAADSVSEHYHCYAT